MRSKFALLVLAIAGIAVMLAACGEGTDDADADSPTEAGAAGETFRVGATLALPPFIYTETTGEVVGFDAEIVRLIGERLGFSDVEFVKTPVSQAITALAADKYDMFAGGLFANCDRLEQADIAVFGVPYFAEGQVISVREEDASSGLNQSLHNLEGHAVGVEGVGTSAHNLAQAFKDEVGFQDVLVFNDNASLFVALQQGRVDAALQSWSVALATAEQREGQFAIGPTLPETSQPVGYLFRPNDDLRQRANDVIDELKEEGVIADLATEWFGTEPEPSNPAVEVVPEVTREEACSFEF